MDDLKKNLTEAEKEAKEAERKRQAIINEEKSQPLNVDTLSREGPVGFLFILVIILTIQEIHSELRHDD